MGVFDSLGISASALTAQRMRMDVISQNIANANSTRTENGGPYRRRVAVLSQQAPLNDFSSYLNNSKKALSGGGVVVSQIVEDSAPFKVIHDPTHPDADENGDVRMPNVDTMQEMLDMMSATRAYESNITALNTTKSMLSKALEIGR